MPSRKLKCHQKRGHFKRKLVLEPAFSKKNTEYVFRGNRCSFHDLSILFPQRFCGQKMWPTHNQGAVWYFPGLRLLVWDFRIHINGVFSSTGRGEKYPGESISFRPLLGAFFHKKIWQIFPCHFFGGLQKRRRRQRCCKTFFQRKCLAKTGNIP